MRGTYEFVWICLNLVEFGWIWLNFLYTFITLLRVCNIYIYIVSEASYRPYLRNIHEFQGIWRGHAMYMLCICYVYAMHYVWCKWSDERVMKGWWKDKSFNIIFAHHFIFILTNPWSCCRKRFSHFLHTFSHFITRGMSGIFLFHHVTICRVHHSLLAIRQYIANTLPRCVWLIII